MSSSRRHLVEDWHDGEFEKRSRRKQCEVEKILKKANPVHEKQLPKREKKERERERERTQRKREQRSITVEKRTENMGSHVSTGMNEINRKIRKKKMYLPTSEGSIYL